MPVRVPNSEVFSLQDIINAVLPSSNDFLQCITDSDPNLFDPAYGAKATANNFLNFRNYAANYSINILNVVTRPFFKGIFDPGVIDGKNTPSIQRYYTADNVQWELDAYRGDNYVYFNVINVHTILNASSTIDWAFIKQDNTVVGSGTCSSGTLSPRQTSNPRASYTYNSERIDLFVKKTSTNTWFRIWTNIDSSCSRWLYVGLSGDNRLTFSASVFKEPVAPYVTHSYLEWQTRDSGNNVLESGTLWGDYAWNSAIPYTEPNTSLAVSSSVLGNTGFASVWGRVRGGDWEMFHSPSGLLPVTKHNFLKLIYTTGIGYTSNQEAVEGHIKKQSDNSVAITVDNPGTLLFESTQRVKVAIIAGSHLSTDITAQGLYFELHLQPHFFSSNANIVHQGNNIYRMNFDLVEGSTSTPSLALNATSLEFDGNGSAIGNDNFSITGDGEWYILCPDWLSLNKYYGSGNDTIYITILDVDHTDSIWVWKMTNDKIECEIVVYAYGYNPEWLGYIAFGYDYLIGSTVHFSAFNSSTDQDDQTKQMYWETRDAWGNTIESGNVTAFLLDAQQSAGLTDTLTQAFDTMWGQVAGGNWVQLF